MKDYLGKLIIVKTGLSEIHSIGVCVSYTERPTIGIQRPDGSRLHWIADLCEIQEIDQIAVDILLQSFQSSTK